MPIYMLSDTATLNDKLRYKLRGDILQAGRRVAYISASDTPQSLSYFETTQSEYRRMDASIRMDYFDLTYSGERLGYVLKYNIMHLSGGNSFEFIRKIRDKHFGRLISQHLSGGGLIVGVSAGAIILTPQLDTAHLAGDKGKYHGSAYEGLGIVPFEFYPHYKGGSYEDTVLSEYAREASAVIFACPDSDGLRIEDVKLTTLCELTCFSGGMGSYRRSLEAG